MIAWSAPMPIVDRTSFKPAWWLPGPHLQTLWPVLFRFRPRPPRTRERLRTPDGDFIDLDWCGPKAAPIVMLLHGLSGSSQSSYIRGMQDALFKRGLRSVALNFRGCSGQPNLTARCYHSGDTEDLDYVYRRLRLREPATPLAAVGYSLGGNVLLKWLGEQGKAVDLSAAAAVSVPLLLSLCADRMDKGFSRLYRNRLLHELKHYVRNKCDYLRRSDNAREAEKLERLGDLGGIRSFWEYDDRVVAPLYAFRDVHDYYRRSSSRQFLKSIQTPTLIVHSADDPFMAPAVIPQEHELSPFVHLEITLGGGHVGFVAGGVPGRPCYWLEQRIPSFLEDQLGTGSRPKNVLLRVRKRRLARAFLRSIAT
jgi:predicted alpha/beta-fold hydrolase